MGVVFERPKALTEEKFSYCPGCHHGIIHRLVAEVIDELGIIDNTVCVSSVGCSVVNYQFFATDAIQAAHGRAPAAATGVKRASPDSIVFTYQGDGDLAAMGTAEIIHAAARNENITVVFVNNAIYGMTGGQMAPTTLKGQKTTTSPYGRDSKREGNPIRVCELLNSLDGPAYLERVSVHDPKHVIRAKKAIKKAFQLQVKGGGFSLVEVLSACPTNWHLSPLAAIEWVKQELMAYYPLGVFREAGEVDGEC